jgi:hypothetical protein
VRAPGAYRARAALLAVLAAAACTDRSPTGADPREPPVGEPGGPTTTVAVLDCTASMGSNQVACRPAAPGTGGAVGDLHVGNQGVYVQLTSTNVNYNAGTGQFTFDATLQNLIEQPLGTTDGTTLDPAGIRIFFTQGPAVTGGTGSAAVVPDGFGFFTAAAQAYYTYPYLLDQSETSPAETWTFIVTPTVTSFQFYVLVSAPVQYPAGYITLDGQLPGYDYGALHPAATHGLTAVIKDPYGVVLPGTVTFGTSSADCASVDGAGLVTGVRAATCTITATAGAIGGEMIFDVTGTGRTWNGSISTDWAVGGNWDGGYTPADVDSVTIPIGVPNFPALTADTDIGGVDVADGATLSLGAFNLGADANVATGPTAGSGILATTGLLILRGTAGPDETVEGRVPSVRVTGRYSLSEFLYVVAPGAVQGGNITTQSYEMRFVSQ